MGEKLDRLIEAAKAGQRPTNAEVMAAAPLGRSVADSNANRRTLLSMAVQISEAATAGQSALVDDLVEDLQFSLDPKAKRAEVDKLAEGIDRLAPTPSTQARRAAGEVRLAAKAQLDDLMARAARGEEIGEEDLKPLAVRDEVTDKQLAGFRARVLTAAADVRKRRGDVDQRDGRQARADDAEYAANRHVAELLSENVVDAPGGNDDLPSDPRALADLIGR